jgi:hypothetical protein
MLKRKHDWARLSLPDANAMHDENLRLNQPFDTLQKPKFYPVCRADVSLLKRERL